MAAATGVVDYLGEPLVDYRQHGENQIGVHRLSLSAKLGRMLEPGEARNRRLAANFSVFYERLVALEAVSDDVLFVAREKRDHERARHAYPESRLRRIGRVMTEQRTGRYALSAHGAADIVRDLIQPAH